MSEPGIPKILVLNFVNDCRELVASIPDDAEPPMLKLRDTLRAALEAYDKSP